MTESPRFIDVTDAAAVRAEAERRLRLRALGLPLSAPVPPNAPPGPAPERALRRDPRHKGHAHPGRPKGAPTATAAPLAPGAPGYPTVDAPIRLTFPLRALCPDNRKYGMLGGRPILTKRYRNAKRETAQRAGAQYRGPALLGPLALLARVWFPGEDGDATNFAKGAHDALQGVVYVNDRQLHRATWERAGIDRRAPRVEITIAPYTPYGPDAASHP